MTNLMTVIEEPLFTKNAKNLLTEEEVDDLIILLAIRPEMGTVLPKSNGCRYIRVAAKGHGKARGGRVIYFYGGPTMPLALLDCHFKGQKGRIGTADHKIYRALVDKLKAEYIP
jgi:hypothetical protein